MCICINPGVEREEAGYLKQMEERKLDFWLIWEQYALKSIIGTASSDDFEWQL